MRLKPVVLSIDDDPSFRKTLELVLGRFGLIVKGVGNEKDFLEAAKALEPDLFLIDLQLELGSGLDLIKKLRGGVAPKAVIIVVSGEQSPQAVANALELGANDYIMKPLDRVLLATKLSQYVDTDKIKEHRSKSAMPPDARAEVRIEFDGVVEEIDELGLKFTSTTLIPKGTMLKMSCEFLEKLGAPRDERLVMVTANWLIPETQRYGAYAEFEGSDTEFHRVVRNWLAQK